METFKLTAQFKSRFGTEKYSYSANNMTIMFHMHPTKAWNFVCDYASSNVTQEIYNNLLNSFLEKGVAQHEYKGGFKEAISVLTF